MIDRKIKGNQAEQIAKIHYQECGYEILESNYRYRRLEIDFIALDVMESLLVFVEVKNRSNTWYGDPETFVSRKQQQRIIEAAEQYLYDINWKKDIRFDIVSLGSNGQLEVFKDAF